MAAIFTSESDYDRQLDLQAFDDTRTGVKGLVDSKISKVPNIFIDPPQTHEAKSGSTRNEFQIPTIDLGGIYENPSKYEKAVEEIRDASALWGFFQVVNHGVPLSAMDDMRKGTLKFFEQDDEAKKQWYTRGDTKPFRYNSNPNLFNTKSAHWRDTFFFMLAPQPPAPEDLPEPCRDILIEHSNHMQKLGSSLLKLLSAALGLDPNHLEEMGCIESVALAGHYYPPCPQPELTIGMPKHTDTDFLTVVLQHGVQGLQVLHEYEWVDVPFVPGAYGVNIGDMLQLVSNDRFKSVEHRVVPNKVGPRVSLSCFYGTGFSISEKKFGPIKELLSENELPKYRETTIRDFYSYAASKGFDGSLLHLKIEK